MAQFYNPTAQQHYPAAHVGSYAHNPAHYGGRQRRKTPGAAQHQKQFRQARPVREAVDSAALKAFIRDFEAARGFDVEDDEQFCPFHLLTEDDLQSIHSGSDRSSLSSGSPEQSPLQHQLQPTPTFVLSSVPNPYVPSGYQQAATQTGKQRSSRAVPIMDPNTRDVVSPRTSPRGSHAVPIMDPSTRGVVSPSSSASPTPHRQMQQQFVSRRW
ncbi:uncharacterized protein EI97DRAFT_455714 [Westerdykella ornata]|uniref:Uncharacterized protein n=1 Tax=Westerdykella ornata TaxID=318751 RepID=A0A6A6JTA6_WESOR|nr:uncharacterized protein EI97DRAFT_455714 [Westerdykella ornata]KAF2279474.1 hypothetical protein EI97DRAFT_455714 [Westerdykella ornata]